MELVTPDIGLVFWTTRLFCHTIVYTGQICLETYFSCRSANVKIQLKALLSKAEAAKEEMARLTSENESLLKQARAERDAILREATKVKDQIISEAKEAAQTEGARMIEKARMEINNQKALLWPM